MANGVYNRGKFLLASGVNLGTANLYVLLVKSDYTFNANNNFYSDLSANEVNVSGYTAFGLALAGKAVVEDDTNGFAFLFGNNLTFTALAAGQNVGGAVLYISTGTAANSQVVAFYDVTDTPTNGGDISINWAANSAGGVLRLT
jgi:hypothetical protein